MTLAASFTLTCDITGQTENFVSLPGKRMTASQAMKLAAAKGWLHFQKEGRDVDLSPEGRDRLFQNSGITLPEVQEEAEDENFQVEEDPILATVDPVEPELISV